MDIAQQAVDFLQSKDLSLVTAESCTGGRVAALLTEAPGCGNCLAAGYVVYSPTAKERELGVSKATMNTYGLTSEEVAIEMATGAIERTGAHIAVATTGVTGDEPMDGVEPGTVWFAWVFADKAPTRIVTRMERFPGNRQQAQLSSARYALLGIKQWYVQP